MFYWKKIRDFVFKNGYKLLILCVLALGTKTWLTHRNNVEKDETIRSLTDSTKTYRNQLGQQVAENSVMKFESSRTIKALTSAKDELTRRLAQNVKDFESKGRGRTSVAVSGTTITTDISATPTIVYIDTNVNKPVYTTSWDEKWSKGTIIATADSISRDIKTRNDFDIIVGHNRENRFSRYKSIVRMTNLNPNTETIEVKTVMVDTPYPSRWGISVGTGGYYDPLFKRGGVGIIAGLTYQIGRKYKR